MVAFNPASATGAPKRKKTEFFYFAGFPARSFAQGKSVNVVENPWIFDTLTQVPFS